MVALLAVVVVVVGTVVVVVPAMVVVVVAVPAVVVVVFTLEMIDADISFTVVWDGAAGVTPLGSKAIVTRRYWANLMVLGIRRDDRLRLGERRPVRVLGLGRLARVLRRRRAVLAVSERRGADCGSLGVGNSQFDRNSQ